MKAFKNLIASVLLYAGILMYSSCETDPSNYCNENNVILPADVLELSDKTITLPISTIAIAGSTGAWGTGDPNLPSVDCFYLKTSRWYASGPSIVTFDDSTSISTIARGLTQAGVYKFYLACTFVSRSVWSGSVNNGNGYTGTPIPRNDSMFVTVLPAGSTQNTFTISPNHYTVQKINKIENYISVLSFRNSTDSGSVTFFFLNDAAIPASGSAGDFKVVPIVRNIDEVRVSAVRTIGNNGTVYDCFGTDNVKANVSVNATGKVSIEMPEALAKRLLEADTVKVSADIHEQ